MSGCLGRSIGAAERVAGGMERTGAVILSRAPQADYHAFV